jgi:hypothetical protein
MNTPKKKFDAESAKNSEDPIVDKPIIDDEDDDFDAPLDDLGVIDDLDSFDDDDDDDF